MYIGFGVVRGGEAYNPIGPGPLPADPEDPVEQPEPNPQKPPEKVEAPAEDKKDEEKADE